MYITLDRTMKGSDQQGSLEPDGMRRMIRDIRNLEMALGTSTMTASPVTASTKVKLARSVASKHDLPANSVITEADLHLLSPGDGVRWQDRAQLIGKTTKVAIAANEVIYPQLVQ